MNYRVQIDKALKNAVFIHSYSNDYLFSPQRQQKWLNEEIVVIENAVEAFGLEQISLSKINQQWGHQNLLVTIQKPPKCGFKFDQFTYTRLGQTVEDYCQYQKHCDDQNYCREKFGYYPNRAKAFYAIFYGPSNGKLLEIIKNKLKNTLFQWTHPNDVLSYLEQHIDGCTNPQFHFKIKGAWTGARQENLGMCAVNINHGPAETQWYTVAGEDVQKLREIIKYQFNQDIYQKEGLWFKKINWFIENGIAITRIIQKPGDLVITGPGTLHWTRGYGVSLHSSWNIFPE